MYIRKSRRKLDRATGFPAKGEMHRVAFDAVPPCNHGRTIVDNHVIVEKKKKLIVNHHRDPLIAPAPLVIVTLLTLHLID